MIISQKKYKIVKNINQYAGAYIVKPIYVPMINEIKVDIRDVLFIIFKNKELFDNVKDHYVKQIPFPIKGFITGINHKTVIEQLNKEKDILPKIENLLKKLLKVSNSA